MNMVNSEDKRMSLLDYTWRDLVVVQDPIIIQPKLVHQWISSKDILFIVKYLTLQIIKSFINLSFQLRREILMET